MSSCTASRTITGSGTVTWSASTAARSWPDGPATRPSASSGARPGRRTSGWWPRRRTPSLPPSPPPCQGHVSATSRAPSAGWAAQRVMESRQVSAAMASAGTCMRTRMSPTMAGRAAGSGCAAAWRSPSSRCSWQAVATHSGWPPTAGRCIPRMAAALRTWSTRSPSPTPGRASSPCPERRCSARPRREPPEDLLQGALDLGHVRTQLSDVGLEPGDIGLEPGDVGLEDLHIGPEPGDVGLEDLHIGLEPGDLGLEDLLIGPEPGDVALEDVH